MKAPKHLSTLHLIAMLFGIVLSGQAIANHNHFGNDKVQLELFFNHWHLRGQQAIHLKKELRRQYPSINPGDYDLRKAIVIAKSRLGHAQVSLRVGRRHSPGQIVGGYPRDFHRHTHHYYRIKMRNPNRNSDGPWQIHFTGNIKVDRIVLNLVPKIRRKQNRQTDERRGHWHDRRTSFH